MTQMTTRTGAALAPAAFGTMQWGGSAEDAASRAMFDACLSAGITHFDTAHVYTDGASETLLGALAEDRDDIFVATKAAYDRPATPDNLRHSLQTSQSRLQRDVIDLFYLHRFDPATPLEQTFETLARMQSDGAIRYIGVSNYAAWQVMKAQAVAATFDTRIDALQPMLNLVKRQAEVELLPMAQDQDIQVCAYSPLGGGLLTGKYAALGAEGRLTRDDRYAKRYGPEWMQQAATSLTDIAHELQTPAATLAIAWLRRHAPQVHPILSARTVEQLQPSLDGLTYEMADDVFAAICDLSPAPAPATDRLEEA
ncbi:aldo/keto reductase [Thalassorhabdomicrobium marinisediminis]|uniref:Aldo/keto reductase n=1 Tax=Thalassorhabdomicrobium marinisediminis TaxID=2170577 RepID=A0A2T7FYA4_9RHOB|nr:aldo/keto reductase [Thalassorhabdomicrobium marinisediminis]PVA07149.1 aldo/keto reductase [Thalassorhabdomicrobium marinisediminis]